MVNELCMLEDASLDVLHYSSVTTFLYQLAQARPHNVLHFLVLKFKRAYLKFSVSARSKQASKQTYTRMCAMKSRSGARSGSPQLYSCTIPLIHRPG